MTAPCHDCGTDTIPATGPCEYYMVHDELWARAGMGHREGDGLLCVGCLERRIGRALTPDDFTDAPLNRMDAYQSDRLLARQIGLAA